MLFVQIDCLTNGSLDIVNSWNTVDNELINLNIPFSIDLLFILISYVGFGKIKFGLMTVFYTGYLCMYLDHLLTHKMCYKIIVDKMDRDYI